MGSLIKWIAIAIGVVVVGLAGLLVAVALFVDINDYKEDINSAVAEATGRDFALEGDLELDLFPWVRVATGRATLGNAPGFSDAPFAAFDRASLSVKVLPLLGGRVEVGEAVLEGLNLNLETKANGSNNWESLSQTGGEAEAAEGAGTEAGGSARVDLNVSAVRMSDATLLYRDGANGAEWQVSDLDFSAENLGGGRPAPLALSARVQGEGVDVTAGVEAILAADLAAGSYSLADGQVDVAGSGIPGDSVSASFSELAADLEADELTIAGLVAQLAGLEARGDLRGTLADGLALGGELAIGEFNPSELLSALNIDLVTADADALKTASATATLDYGPGKALLNSVTMNLDDTALTGSAGLRGDAVEFDLTMDAINVDRYLPPSEDGEAGASSEEGDLDEVDLPTDAIRSTPVKGKFAIGQAQFAGLKFQDLKLDVTGRNGRLTLTPSANVYEGRYAGEIVIDASGDAARLSLEQELTGVALGALGQDLSKVEDLTGTTAATMKLSGRGNRVGDQIRTLTGNFAFTIDDGTWEGTDLWYELRRARALFKREEPPAKPEGPERTRFSEVAATGVVTNGVMRNEDLKAALPFLRLSGKGEVNLIESVVDYDLVAEVLDRPELAEEGAADLAGTKVPLKVSGPMADPKVRPDFAALIKEEAKEKIKDKLLDKLGLGGDEEAAEGEEKPDLKDRLKDLFGS